MIVNKRLLFLFKVYDNFVNSGLKFISLIQVKKTFNIKGFIKTGFISLWCGCFQRFFSSLLSCMEHFM